MFTLEESEHRKEVTVRKLRELADRIESDEEFTEELTIRETHHSFGTITKTEYEISTVRSH